MRPRAPRAAATLVALATATALAVPAEAAEAAGPHRANPTGTRSGSAPNGSGYLKMGLANTSDGRLQITWRRPAPPRKLRGFIVRVGPNRSLNSRVRRYVVGRTRQSIVVPHAFGAAPASGNFSFVKLTVVRRDRSRGSTVTKWIQAPLEAGCPSGPTVRVGTFNVRNWANGDRRKPRRLTWAVRGPRAVNEILRSGAHAVAVQEASGLRSRKYGNVRQSRWLLNHLNARDTDRSARWVDSIGDDALHRGLVGTRVIYDASKYERPASGYRRVPDRTGPTAFVPWVRLRVPGTSTSFVLASTHLAVGDRAADSAVRRRELQQIIPFLRDLHASTGDQVILGGDLNSTVNTRPYNVAQRALIRAGFYDSFATARITNSRYGTSNNLRFPVRATPYRRDYLMTYGGARGSCAYVNMVYRKPSRLASDHFMQVAVLPVG